MSSQNRQRLYVNRPETPVMGNDEAVRASVLEVGLAFPVQA
jgi:hypothetical protein